ncbi:hypothetical protein DMB66_53335 [Actinoplanes sp. ATCC 53533]|nr:hypothetical protein DMB66_53335 [Actinoplanes sp. ATCC 53533]
MTTTLDAEIPPSTRSGHVAVLPVRHGDRPVGAWIVGSDTAVFRPVVDVSRLAAAALAAAAAATIATVVVTCRRPAIGAVTMGPGGWISLKRTTRPALFSAAPRPWWARMLRAHRLVVER